MPCVLAATFRDWAVRSWLPFPCLASDKIHVVSKNNNDVHVRIFGRWFVHCAIKTRRWFIARSSEEHKSDAAGSIEGLGEDAL